MPTLPENELGYQTEEKALYIGTSNDNVRLCGAGDPEVVKKCAKEVENLQEAVKGFVSKEYVDGIVEQINTQLTEINETLSALETPSE